MGIMCVYCLVQADLQARALPRRGGHQNVRRTHSDLGGQRMFNWDMRNSYRRMFSTPSPIKMKPSLSPRKCGPMETPVRTYVSIQELTEIMNRC